MSLVKTNSNHLGIPALTQQGFELCYWTVIFSRILKQVAI